MLLDDLMDPDGWRIVLGIGLPLQILLLAWCLWRERRLSRPEPIRETARGNERGELSPAPRVDQ